ncbi:MAG: hypothetical protein AAGA92_02845 [Planctomycetota bacterium]
MIAYRTVIPRWQAFSLLLTPLLAPLAEARPSAEDEKADAASTATAEAWVRLAEDDQGKAAALEVAVASYAPNEAAGRTGYTVDLVGAIHVGDRDYYRELNRRFREYDSVLYELVAPDGTVVPRGRGTSSTNPLGAVQNGMKSMLGLEHQLEQVDYTRANFVHADISPDQFLESMERRDESFSKMYFRMVGQAIAQQSRQSALGESADLDIFSALMSKDRPRRLKIALAKQFGAMDDLLSGLSGPNGSTIITERNKRALEVLRQRIDAGDRRIAVFYGAGHLSEMHDELLEGFGLEQTSKKWLEAWDLRPDE